jgi:hypothetical protein
MKQLLSLFLLLLPCLAFAQYPSNGNQKITLGEQTTADGLVYRGVAATDTVRKPSIDTMAYMVLDTTTNIIWHYKKATSNAWLRLNLLPSDTASMLTNYYRSGRTGIIQASDIPTLNQNTTGSAATLTTSRTFQTNLASTSTASFNGSANVTPGVTGTLPIANGGTNTSTAFTAGSIVFAGTSGTYTQDNEGLYYDDATNRMGVNTSSVNTNETLTILMQNNSNQTGLAIKALNNGGAASQPAVSFYNGSNTKIGGFYFDNGTNYFGVSLSGNDYLVVKGSGEVNIGYEATADNGNYRLQIKDSLYVGGNVSASAYTTRSDFNLKDDIFDLKYGLNDILQLQPVEYTYKSNGSKQFGFIAQDIGTILPEVVSFEESMSVNYQAIIPILTKAIQEQQALIKALEQRIINLENK